MYLQQDSTPFTGKKKGGSNGSPPDTGCEFVCCKTHGGDGNFQANSGGVAGWPSRISPMGTRSTRSCTTRGCLQMGLLPVGKFLGIRSKQSPERRRSSAHWEKPARSYKMSSSAVWQCPRRESQMEEGALLPIGKSLLARMRCRHRLFGSAREGKVKCGLSRS
jgi:hypothetical protein